MFDSIERTRKLIVGIPGRDFDVALTVPGFGIRVGGEWGATGWNLACAVKVKSNDNNNNIFYL